MGNMLPAGRPTQPARPRSEQCVGYRLSAEGGWRATIVFLSPLHKKNNLFTRTCESFWLCGTCVSASSSSVSSVCCSSSPSQP